MEDDWTAIQEHAARARGGSRAGWGALYRALRPHAVRFCRRALPMADAEDLAEGTLLRIRLRLERYDATRPFRPWFVQVMSHALLDELRKRQTRGWREVAQSSDLVEESAQPETDLMLEQSRAQVRRAMARLPPRARLALVLRYYADQSYAEIGLALGATPEQVGMILHRARQALRRLLAESNRPPGGPQKDG